MAWNEPGGDNRDPWGGRGGKDGPPDLDEVARKMRDRMNSIFGGGKKGGGGSSSISIGTILVLAVAGWALSGIYIVDAAERGVVLRLGEFNKITMPGIHWFMRGIEQVETVDVDAVRTVSHRANMLTKDENIIQVELAVQYQIKDAQDYLFGVRDPDYTLQEATESALREVIGAIPMDEFLTGGRGEIVQQTKTITQGILDQYGTGLILTSVNLQDPQPPEEVQGAFEDVIKAREDQVRYKNQAEAVALDIVPKARGDAARMREAANAYREQVIAKAEGETSRFRQTLAEYEKAPEITRKRLYLETMEYVLANNNKVLMTVKGGNNLMYLPLDKLMQGREGSDAQAGRDLDSAVDPGSVSGSRDLPPARRSSDRGEGRR
ncbi:MAG: FtsH protease activity modulator HflK [Gammaproteobacteria bacterium]|nr:FtsH protease activity modulator HflK [Gammaproteobacteria bacterium]